jgi:rhamnose transport system permease protein
MNRGLDTHGPWGTLRPVLRWETGLCLLIVLVTVGSTFASSDFLTSFNLVTMALSATVLGFLALGVAPVIMAGDIDISIASTLALCGVVLAECWQHGMNIWAASLIAVGLGVILGLINGLLTVLLELPSLAITLGTLGAYSGIAFLILQGQAITGFPDGLVTLGQGELFGSQFPISTGAVLVAALIMTIVIHGTTFGKAVFAIGGSRQAALYSGIAVTRTRVLLFAISGGVSGLASIFYLGNFDTARADMASDQVLPAVTVAILGGVSAYGGKGTIPGVVLALVLLSVLEAGLGVLGLSGQEQTISIGLLLIIAIGSGNMINSAPRWVRRLPRQRGNRPLERKEEPLVTVAAPREH